MHAMMEPGAGHGSTPELADLFTQFVRAYLNNGHANDLRPAQWEVIRFLADAEDEERTVSGVARHQRTTLGTASITVSALERRGLVARGPRRRVQRIDLTDAARALLAADPIAKLERGLAGLDPRERAAFEAAVKKGIDALEADSEALAA